MSRIRKILLGLFVVVLLAGGLAAYFVLTFDANRYRGLVLSQLSQAVNRPVEAADLELQLFPLRLRLNQVRIPEDPGFNGQDFLRARSVQFEFSLWSFLQGRPRALALELDQATLFVRSDQAGRWNVTTLAATSEEQAPAEAPVRNWSLREGTIVVETPGHQPLRLVGIEATVSDVSLNRPFPFEAAVNFSPESRLSASGHLGPLNAEQPGRTPVTADILLMKFRPAAVSSLVALPAAVVRLPEIEGTLTLRVTTTDTTLEGDLVLPGGQSGAAMAVAFSAVATPDWNRVELRKAALESAGTRVSGSGNLDFSEETQRFDLILSTSNADLDALKRLPPRLGWPLPPTVPPLSGGLTAALKLSGTPAAWQLTGTATGRDLRLALVQLSEPLRIPTVEVTLEPSRLRTSSFVISPSPGLNLNVTASVDDYHNRPLLNAQLSGEALPLEPLLSLLESFGVSPLSPGWTLTGRASPRIQLSGPLAEPAGLRYQGTLALRDLSLAIPELSGPVSSPAVELSFSAVRLAAEPFTANFGNQIQARASFRLENYSTRPTLSASLATEAASLEALLGLARSFGTDPLPGGRAWGRINTTIELSGPLGEGTPPLTIQGRARFSEASVQPAGLSAPIGVERADLEFTPRSFSLANARLLAAGTAAQGSFRVDDFDAPQIRFDLRGDVVDIERLQALFVAPAGRATGGVLSLPLVHAQERQDTWFSRVRGNGRMEFGQVRHGTLTLAPFTAPVAIANQVVTCNPLEFGFYDGGGRGRLVIDLQGSEPVTEFEGLLRGVDANQLLSANSESKDRLHGRLGGTLTVRFAGSERQRITPSAAGKGQLTLVQGRLARVNLSREVVAVGQLAGLRLEGGDTPIEDMVTDLEIGGGWVRTGNLTLRTPDLTMTAVGGFSLQDELAFEATAVFTPEASRRLTSGNPLGALTGKVLNDEQGRTVIPFLIRGTSAQPKFSLDSKRLLDRQLRRGRGAAESVLDILDRLRKKPEPPR